MDYHIYLPIKCVLLSNRFKFAVGPCHHFIWRHSLSSISAVFAFIFFRTFPFSAVCIVVTNPLTQFWSAMINMQAKCEIRLTAQAILGSAQYCQVMFSAQKRLRASVPDPARRLLCQPNLYVHPTQTGAALLFSASRIPE